MTGVDVAIVSYRSATSLPGCIAAARAWSRVERIVVVDNASPDGSASVARELADEVVVSDDNMGFGAAQNEAVRRCTAATVVLLNPDARIIPDGFERGLAALNDRPRVAAVEGRIRRSSDGAEERWQGPEPGVADLAARLLQLRERLGENRLRQLAQFAGQRHYAERAVDQPTSVAFLAAVALLVRRAAFDDVGGFDPEFFLYAEDVDLCHRLAARGWELLALPDEWAVHDGGASTSDTPAWRQLLWWQSHELLVRRHWTGGRRALGLAMTRAGEARARRHGVEVS